MKQNSLLTRMLLLVALVLMGAGTIWGESIEINTTNSGVTGSYQDKEFDVNDITFKFTQWMKNTNIQAKKSTTNSCYNIDAIPGTITSIVVVQTGTARAITMYGGTSEKPTTQITSPSTAATMTFDFSGKNYNYFSLTTPGNACYFDKITINYTPSGSGSAVATTTTIDATGITNTDVYTGTDAGSLSATVKDNNKNAISGATVTWSGNNDEVATIDESTGEVTLVAAGTVTFTASYAGVENEYLPSSATYEMTVTSSAPYVQPTEFDINLNNSLFGTEYNGSASGITDADPLVGTQDNVTVTYAGSGNHYVNNSQIRVYPNNKLTFEAPSGYVIEEIVFTSAGTWAATITANEGDYDTSEKTWTGSAATVVFTGSGSSRCDMSKVSIKLAVPSTDPSISADNVNIAYDATSGSIGYTLKNPVNGGVLTAEVSIGNEGNWFTLGAVGTDNVSFTCTANESTAEREVLVTLTYTYGSENVTADVVVTQAAAPDPNAHGTVNNPFTVAEALAATPQDGVYVSGIVCEVNSTSVSKNGQIRYHISDDGTTTSSLNVYNGLGLNGDDFTSIDDIQVGDVVVVFGNISEYNGANQLDANNYLISLVRPVVPSITVDPASVSVDAVAENNALMVDGTLDITLENITISDMSQFEVRYFTSENESTTQPNWLEVLVAEQDPAIGTGYVVSYTILDNDGEERSAYFKVYGLGDDGTTEALSNLVTVTQAAYVAPPTGYQYALFTGDLVEGDYIIYYNGKAMSNDVENDRLQYAEVTPENDVITTDNAAIVWHIAPSDVYWTLYNAEADAFAASTGVKNKAQMWDDETDDMALWTVSGTETYEFVNKKNTANKVNANLRNNGTYGFACYATSTGGALSLYKRVTESVNITAAGYATYCSDKALDYSAVTGLTAYKATVANKQVSFTEVTEVPANAGVLLKGAEGTYKIPVISSAAALEDNAFVGVLEETNIAAGSFVLLNGDKGVGFYKTTATFTAGAHTAYLPASVGEARSFIGFDGETTGVNAVNGEGFMVNGPVIDLQGRRVAQPQKGLYIVNGKKVVIK